MFLPYIRYPLTQLDTYVINRHMRKNPYSINASQITVYLLAKLKDIATASGITLNQLIRNALIAIVDGNTEPLNGKK
jgi:hypothetical protein